MDDDFDDHHHPWTPDGAERLAAAGEQLAAGIKAHAAAIASTTGRRDWAAVSAATDALLPLLLSYADAQFAYTGNGFPFDALRQFTMDDDEDDELPTEGRPPTGVSILRRHDYGVLDEATILAAGRAAYLRSWPDESEQDAAAEVSHLGVALYQIAHADGWDALDGTDGLRPLGGATQVIDQDQPLSADPDEWPDDPFATAGEVLFQQSDIWG